MQDVFKIFTKEDHKRYMLKDAEDNEVSKRLKLADKVWGEISKGYNFIIGVGKDEVMFYSVEYFNNNVLEGDNKIKQPKNTETFEVGVELDTTEAKEKLNEIEKQLDRINYKIEDISLKLGKNELGEILTDTIRMLVYKD